MFSNENTEGRQNDELEDNEDNDPPWNPDPAYDEEDTCREKGDVAIGVVVEVGYAIIEDALFNGCWPAILL